MSLPAALREGLAALGVTLPQAAQEKLLAYLALLKKWNRTYNLTAIRDDDAILTHHLLDSLSVLPALWRLPDARGAGSSITGQRWADVGSGAGLPGIPLAIACPDLQVVLIDAVDKKTAFQRQAKIELGLSNVEVAGRRVEDMPAGQFDALISRAFAELADFIRLAGHLLLPAGRLYAMKGQLPQDEIDRLPCDWTLVDCLPLNVPGLDAQRHLLVIEKA